VAVQKDKTSYFRLYALLRPSCKKYFLSIVHADNSACRLMFR